MGFSNAKDTQVLSCSKHAETLSSVFALTLFCGLILDGAFII